MGAAGQSEFWSRHRRWPRRQLELLPGSPATGAGKTSKPKLWGRIYGGIRGTGGVPPSGPNLTSPASPWRLVCASGHGVFTAPQAITERTNETNQTRVERGHRGLPTSVGEAAPLPNREVGRADCSPLPQQPTRQEGRLPPPFLLVSMGRPGPHWERSFGRPMGAAGPLEVPVAPSAVGAAAIRAVNGLSRKTGGPTIKTRGMKSHSRRHPGRWWGAAVRCEVHWPVIAPAIGLPAGPWRVHRAAGHNRKDS